MVVDGLGTYSDGIGSPALVFDLYTNHPMVFNTNFTEAFRLQAGGDFRIQNGQGDSATAFTVNQTDGTNLLTADTTNAKVGVGTSSPVGRGASQEVPRPVNSIRFPVPDPPGARPEPPGRSRRAGSGRHRAGDGARCYTGESPLARI